MGKNRLNHKYTASIIIILLIATLCLPGGSSYKQSDKPLAINTRYASSHFPYTCNPIQREQYQNIIQKKQDGKKIQIKNNSQILPALSHMNSLGPMVSAWPQHGFDNHSTGRSPYATSNTTSLEKWRFFTEHGAGGGGVIDSEGILYFCDTWGELYAIYPNGTQKWSLFLDNFGACDFGNSPALDDQGVIYVGGHECGLCAVHSNGSLLWKYGWGAQSSPVIGPDGIIYCSLTTGSPWTGVLHAFYPNGTIKWSFHTAEVIQSSPAIGLDGNIIFGSHDEYVYSIYPTNGSMKWKYKTGSWVHGSPTIGTDGTIYVGADDNYLYALNPTNGTLQWKCLTGAMRSSPSLDKKGNLYFATVNERFFAVYPNGTLKWSFSPKNYSGEWGSTAAISDDGIIYFGFDKRDYYPEGGWIFALDLNGTELWRKTIANDYTSSSPCIGADGTVYIGSDWSKRIGPGNSWALTGYIHAFGPIESNKPPNSPEITGPVEGNTGLEYDHWFTASDPDNNPIRYYIDWGDNTTTNWTREYAPRETMVMEHIWNQSGNYTIRAKVKDILDEESEWGTYTITIDTLPSIEITKPKVGLYICNSIIRPFLFKNLRKPIIIGPIDIEVYAFDEESGIDRVEFYLNDEVQYIDDIYPFMWSLNNENEKIFDSINIKTVVVTTDGQQSSDSMLIRKIL